MRGGTGLLTRDVLPVIRTFSPFRAVVCRGSSYASLTVAGQWRTLTALSVHPTSGFFCDLSDRQNSIPFCAAIPCSNGCLSKRISVARSAISIISGFAFLPVKMTCNVEGLFLESSRPHRREKLVTQRAVDFVQDHDVKVSREDRLLAACQVSRTMALSISMSSLSHVNP